MRAYRLTSLRRIPLENGYVCTYHELPFLGGLRDKVSALPHCLTFGISLFTIVSLAALSSHLNNNSSHIGVIVTLHYLGGGSRFCCTVSSRYRMADSVFSMAEFCLGHQGKLPSSNFSLICLPEKRTPMKAYRLTSSQRPPRRGSSQLSTNIPIFI